MTRKIAVLVGSLRKESFNRKIANAIEEIAGDRLAFDYVPIDEVGHYNQDLDTDTPPEAWAALRSRIKGADAVLFVTPEYNRSLPGVLKNAIDIASRPYGKSAFAGKPAAVVSASPGAIGGFGANHHLRQVLHFLDMPALQQPEMYLGGVGDWFDDAGKIVKQDKRDYLAGFVDSFTAWIDLNTK